MPTFVLWPRLRSRASSYRSPAAYNNLNRDSNRNQSADTALCASEIGRVAAVIPSLCRLASLEFCGAHLVRPQRGRPGPARPGPGFIPVRGSAPLPLPAPCPPPPPGPQRLPARSRPRTPNPASNLGAAGPRPDELQKPNPSNRLPAPGGTEPVGRAGSVPDGRPASGLIGPVPSRSDGPPVDANRDGQRAGPPDRGRRLPSQAA